PRDAVAMFRTEQRKHRKTRVQPSQFDRSKKRPKKGPHDYYTTLSYGCAIGQAYNDAFPPPEPLAKRDDETGKEWRVRLTPKQRSELCAWRRANRWTPNQLRHLHATEVRRRYGLEAAQVALGHAQADVTQIYAERNLALAQKVAAEMG